MKPTVVVIIAQKQTNLGQYEKNTRYVDSKIFHYGIALTIILISWFIPITTIQWGSKVR